MADTGSSGVSGSGSSQSAADSSQQSQAAAETAAAQQAAADKAAADAAAEAAVDQVQAAPVDLSVSATTLSQLSTMQVDTVPSLSSFQTLGGVPNAATYADIAQSLPATPATPAITEFNAFSPTFSITPNDPKAVAAATLNDVSVNLGLNYTGDVDANLQARMGIDPGRIGFAADVSVSNAFNSLSVSTALGPFGPGSTPSYTGAVKGTVDLGNLNSFDFSAAATFNNQGFQNADVSAKLSKSFTENLNGYVQGGVAVDQQGVSRITGEAGLNATQNGLSFGVTGRSGYDVRTGETSGYFGFKAGGKF